MICISNHILSIFLLTKLVAAVTVTCDTCIPGIEALFVEDSGRPFHVHLTPGSTPEVSPLYSVPTLHEHTVYDQVMHLEKKGEK